MKLTKEQHDFVMGYDRHPVTCVYCEGNCLRRFCVATGPIGDAALELIIDGTWKPKE